MSMMLSFVASSLGDTFCMLGSLCRITCMCFWNRLCLSNGLWARSKEFPHETQTRLWAVLASLFGRMNRSITGFATHRNLNAFALISSKIR